MTKLRILIFITSIAIATSAGLSAMKKFTARMEARTQQIERIIEGQQ